MATPSTISTTTVPLRVLLIAASEADAALVVRSLTRGGYTVVFERVESPEALTAALDGGVWDFAIADYTMPRFSGTSALELVRSRDQDMPFIFVSGTVGEDAVVAAMKTGAHDYITKGQMKRLVPAIDRELHDARVRREQKLAERRLAHLAYHDALTDLPNRTLLHDRLQQAVLGAHRTGKPLTLLVMDLDRFKEINDTLGHHAGDRVLQLVASRLRGTLRDVDTVARLGGDEFALVLPGTDLDGAVAAAAKLLQEVSRPLVVDGQALEVRASIGIARFPEHGTGAETLLKKADIAMYLAKGDAAGYAIYAPDRDRHSHHRVTLAGDLAAAIEHDQFFLEYQPILHLRTGLVVGVEALVRWNHPRQGRLLPAEFIQLAEQTGLIRRLTPLVIAKALDEWPDADPSMPLTISVNVCSRNLQDPELPNWIQERLKARGPLAPPLALEITENIIMSDPTRSMESLTTLHDMGVRLAIDDFGTGYSSLGYLRRLPIDELKIDRSFVVGLGAGNDEVIVRSTIGLAHNLGLSVVAEGVESLAVQGQLLSYGCDAAQGVFIREPAAASLTREWIARRNAVGSIV